MSTNPLKAFARVPKIYISLPSGLHFYSKDLLKTSQNGEIGIKALTARDDLILKNPDALLNGEAVRQVLSSCIDCKDVTKLLLPDVESILLAIYSASNGPNLKFTTKCPKCKKDIEDSMNIREQFDFSSQIKGPEFVEFKPSDEITIRVNIKPSLYSEVSSANLLAFNQMRLIQYLQANDNIADEDRQNRTKKAVEELAKFQLNTLVNSIETISVHHTSGEEETVETISDKKYILEFINDVESSDSTKISEKLEELNSYGLPPNVGVKCEECDVVFPVEVKFNPENFFDPPFFNSVEKK